MKGKKYIKNLGLGILSLLLFAGSITPIYLKPLPALAAAEYLRPNAAGDECNIPFEWGDACPNHYLNVDEEVSDEGDTWVASAFDDNSWVRDLYNTANHTAGSGVINNIVVVARCKGSVGTAGQTSLKIVIKSGTGSGNPDTISESDEKTITFSFTNYPNTWTTNPATSAAWTWDEIDRLQIGVSIRPFKLDVAETLCTQVYVVVGYTPPIAPTVTTQACTDVEVTTATGNGNITSTGGENATRRGFCYKVGTSGDPTTADSTVYDDGSFGTGAYSKGITGLSAGTNYRVRAYAINSAGTGYGTTVQLTTIGVPTVTTQACTSVAVTSATGNGNITNTGGSNATRRGFCYKVGTTGDPTTADSTVYDDGSFGTGAYTKSIPGLSAGTNYRVRAYAVNMAGTAYGATVQLTTYNYPTITTNNATYITISTARLNASVVNDGGTACEVRFQYYTGAGDWTDNETAWVPGYTTGQHPFKDIDSLNDNTLYHFRVQARIGSDNVTGSGVDFTTLLLIGEPSNFKSFPGSNSVSLSWVKDEGANETLIRFTETHYPTTTADGTQVYLGTSSSTSHTGLLPGHTIYYSAWGKSGATYSDNYTTVMATTLAIVSEGDAPEAPDTPATWFQTPDYTKFSPLPVYDPMNKAADALQIPRGSFWMFSGLLLCVASGIITFVISKHAVPPLIVLAVVLALCSLAGLLPMWMMAFTLLFGLGAWQIGRVN